MIDDRVIVAFKQGCKDEMTTKKLATKNPKTMAELYNIIEATGQPMPEPECTDKPTPPEQRRIR
jgi:hypothetical protein